MPPPPPLPPSSPIETAFARRPQSIRTIATRRWRRQRRRERKQAKHCRGGRSLARYVAPPLSDTSSRLGRRTRRAGWAGKLARGTAAEAAKGPRSPIRRGRHFPASGRAIARAPPTDRAASEITELSWLPAATLVRFVSIQRRARRDGHYLDGFSGEGEDVEDFHDEEKRELGEEWSLDLED